MPETRVPVVDLEDREKDYRLKAEMPGFKKEDIEIEVQDNLVVIAGEVGWKYDKKEHEYICKERACKSFYRVVDLPEEIKADEVTANLSEGVLEVMLPKKVPKQKTTNSCNRTQQVKYSSNTHSMPKLEIDSLI